ncbi:hypothetical protein MA16_Dca026773 [Dendrobium catenatum]|uniref:Uncharacterized protein n=1 Tax=Dendrobium catenatum TaxID=906689 RepID=A0A2I0VPN0_9ASPA|nr:hypothetical protein MA16_Dca026773 [Dendrobium catenatum]
MPVSGPPSRGSISVVHSNYSQLIIDFPSIRWFCHSQKTINTSLILHGRRDHSKREEKKIRDYLANKLLLYHFPSIDHHQTDAGLLPYY